MTKENSLISLGDVLVVDDRLPNLQVLSSILEHAGYSVRCVTNGEAAITACESVPPELILLDIIMPKMSGYEVCKTLKAKEQIKDIPIIFISAMDMLDDRLNGFKIGAVDYITKPFEPEEVLVRVNTHIQLYKMKINLESLVNERTQALMQSNLALIKSEEKFRGLVENTNDLILEVNARCKVNYISPQIMGMLGYHPDTFIGKTLFEFMPDDGRHTKAIVQNFVSEHEPYHEPYKEMEIIFLHKNGLRVLIESSGVPIVDRKGVFQGYRSVNRDITERKNTEDKLKFLTEHEPITNLYNRYFFNRRLDQILGTAALKNRKVAIMILSLTHFKDVNETFGHAMSDKFLVCVSKQLSIIENEVELVAHFGGDEFALILDDVEDIDNVKRLAEKLLKLMFEPVFIEKNEIFTGINIGISLYPENGNQTLVLCRNADSALTHAKKIARNNYLFYMPDFTQAAADRLDLATRLRHALENHEFQLFYQPQIELKNNRIIGAEALIRRIDLAHGLVFPGEFIPVAEDTGLILPIGEWVLHEACRQFAQWRDEGNPLDRISVNISGLQIQRANLAVMVSQVLTDFQIQPDCLDLEVTESMLMDNPEYVTEVLHALRSLGVSLAVDDFGTGYSSLSYLKQFPINTLKIDRSFVEGVPNNTADSAIVKAIIMMSDSLQLDTLAEGIETQEQRNFLIDEGCKYGQGYYFSRPVCVSDFSEFLRLGFVSD